MHILSMSILMAMVTSELVPVVPGCITFVQLRQSFMLDYSTTTLPVKRFPCRNRCSRWLPGHVKYTDLASRQWHRLSC
jgi:hypothetical protein